ncbi:unnamed protein product [Vitrella brassicaformis CCMP3155]|uniref:Uncharacterized protein n=1 Tax=Vitrella brassicaformis (strain CCMP3155) TaxID=1169540 RepID=A0A0G4FHI7_VITBC|nr:unnamed protein product [Vitrella brassicaformis CCMP3155]|eukprot:CEM12890.1 unnamed protein product [Vitrella brassicaformis CCMP3155]
MTGSFAIGSLPTALPLTAFHAPPLLVPPRRPFRSLTRRRPLVSTHRPLHALHGDAPHDGDPDAADADGIDERGGFYEYGAPGSQPLYNASEDLQRDQIIDVRGGFRAFEVPGSQPLYMAPHDQQHEQRRNATDDAAAKRTNDTEEEEGPPGIITKLTEALYERGEMERGKEPAELVYERGKGRLRADIVTLLVVGFSLQWFTAGVGRAISYTVGGILGMVYALMPRAWASLQRLFKPIFKPCGLLLKAVWSAVEIVDRTAKMIFEELHLGLVYDLAQLWFLFRFRPRIPEDWDTTRLREAMHLAFFAVYGFCVSCLAVGLHSIVDCIILLTLRGRGPYPPVDEGKEQIGRATEDKSQRQ